jgi:hypothetical protein
MTPREERRPDQVGAPSLFLLGLSLNPLLPPAKEQW